MKKIILIFLALFSGFLFGVNFNLIKEKLSNDLFRKKACTLEAKVCPDGTVVGRIPPNCDFAPCPAIKKEKEIKGEICGGIANLQCPKGYRCQIEERYPDASGFCVKDENQFVCPKEDYIDCMPGPDPKKPECDSQYIKWVKQNCPNFKEVVY